MKKSKDLIVMPFRISVTYNRDVNLISKIDYMFLSQKPLIKKLDVS